MAISETVLILAGGTAARSIAFSIRLALRAVADGAPPRRRDRMAGRRRRHADRSPDVAGVIAARRWIFIGFLAAADPADDGAGRRRHLSANQEPALSGIDPHLPGPRRRGGKPVGHRARRPVAVGHQYRRHRAGRAQSEAEVRGRVSRVQGAGAAVDLMGRGPDHMVRDYRCAVSST
jgi:hypothetical protein